MWSSSHHCDLCPVSISMLAEHQHYHILSFLFYLWLPTPFKPTLVAVFTILACFSSFPPICPKHPCHVPTCSTYLQWADSRVPVCGSAFQPSFIGDCDKSRFPDLTFLASPWPWVPVSDTPCTKVGRVYSEIQ